MSNAQLTRPHPDSRFWNRMARHYARKSVPDHTAHRTKLAKTAAYLKPSDRVLEIGCGTGSAALHHAPRASQIVATDISPRMIDIARDKAEAAGIENVTFEVSSIDRLDTSQRYDVILALNVLHLVADVPRTLRQLRRMLTPEGLLISDTPCIGDSAAWIALVAPLGRALGIFPRINVFGITEFAQWIVDAGFDLEEAWQPAPKASYYVVAPAAPDRR